jgi:hypothetical protein
LPVPALADLAPELLRPAGQGFRSRRVAGTNWRSGVLTLALLPVRLKPSWLKSAWSHVWSRLVMFLALGAMLPQHGWLE